MTMVIAAGGTGGHLYPGIALARELLRRRPDARVRFVGTTRGLESKVVPHEGFPLDLITAKPLMGLGIKKMAAALAALPVGLLQSLRLLRAHRADLVIGIGGYTSPPVLMAAWLLRIPRAIMEPNAYPGMANRALAPFVDRIYVAFKDAATRFASSRVRVVGTPIRRAFLEAATEPHAGRSPRTILVFGGSQGAQALNTAVIEALPRLRSAPSLTVVHQTGDKDQARVRAAYEQAGMAGRATIMPFVFDMPATMREADLVVARSGAVTVAELTAMGKPALLVPLPQSIYGHQAKNAAVLEAAGAAIVIPQSRLTGEALSELVLSLWSDPSRLTEMARRSRELGRTDAAESIIRDCLGLMGAAQKEAGTAG